MTEKCFCHLGGYKVKDADAHANIAKNYNEFKTHRDSVNSFITETVKNEQNLLQLHNNQASEINKVNNELAGMDQNFVVFNENLDKKLDKMTPPNNFDYLYTVNRNNTHELVLYTDGTAPYTVARRGPKGELRAQQGETSDSVINKSTFDKEINKLNTDISYNTEYVDGVNKGTYIPAKAQHTIYYNPNEGAVKNCGTYIVRGGTTNINGHSSEFHLLILFEGNGAQMLLHIWQTTLALSSECIVNNNSLIITSTDSEYGAWAVRIS